LTLKFNNSTEPTVFEHRVQFYRTEDFLIRLLADFAKTGIAQGDACIIIATKNHRKALEQRLEAEGVDLVTAKATEQYTSLDAAATFRISWPEACLGGRHSTKSWVA
jgi:DcmR-like sensory protein